MSESLQLDIVTPKGSVLSTKAEYVSIPGLQGDFGILPDHIPFLSALHIGSLYYKINGNNKFVFIGKGFAEVSDNKITILANVAELAENIDKARAEEAKKRAEERLAENRQDVNSARAKAALLRAITRITLASKND